MFVFKDESYRTTGASLSYAFMKLARVAGRIEKAPTDDARKAAVMELLSLQLDTLERVIHPEDFPRLETALDESTFMEIEEAINTLVASQAGQGKDESEPSTASQGPTRTASVSGSSRPAAKARAKKS